MDQPLTIKYGNLEGLYFTQWRIEVLKELMQLVVYNFGEQPLIEYENLEIWYDAQCDYHRLSYVSGDSRISVRFYKVFTAIVNNDLTDMTDPGEKKWQGCQQHAITHFAHHLRNLSKRADNAKSKEESSSSSVESVSCALERKGL